MNFFICFLLTLARMIAAHDAGDSVLEKSAIRDLIAKTPNLPQNKQLLSRLNQLLQSKKVLRDPFIYTANVTSLAGGANTTNNINIQADADFLIQALVYFADLALATQTQSTQVLPLCTVLLTDSGSGRQFMDTDVAINSIFGYGGVQPFVLPQPKLMAARSTLVVKTTNFTAATTYNIRLSFIGVKLFSL
jgi:hypothetical protein